jgi:alpha-galactosidase
MLRGQSALKRVLQFWAVGLLLSHLMMSQNPKTGACEAPLSEIVAAGVSHDLVLNAARPAAAWSAATPVRFCSDWQGKNPAPDRETTVRALWFSETLYLRFECRYRELNLFTDSDPDGRRDQLWDRDVAEAFLQPDPAHPHAYKEFEVSPNGMWIDLDIAPGVKPNLNSGMTRSVFLDEKAHAWSAELAIPIRSLTGKFDPMAIWRVNFFRVEGKQEPRGYYAWQPTHTPQPNFHVPEAFGRMRFDNAK